MAIGEEKEEWVETSTEGCDGCSGVCGRAKLRLRKGDVVMSSPLPPISSAPALSSLSLISSVRPSAVLSLSTVSTSSSLPLSSAAL